MCSVASDSLQHPGVYVARQAPLSMEFSRQEYWSGLLFPPPGDLPNPGIKPWSPSLQADSLLSEPPGIVNHTQKILVLYNSTDRYHYLRYADDTTLMGESEEELKSLLMKVKEESEKVGLKCSIQRTKIMASGPITSWQIDGETMGTVTDFIWGGSKISADGGDCSHEIKRRLLLGRKVMTHLDSIL